MAGRWRDLDISSSCLVDSVHQQNRARSFLVNPALGRGLDIKSCSIRLPMSLSNLETSLRRQCSPPSCKPAVVSSTKRDLPGRGRGRMPFSQRHYHVGDAAATATSSTGNTAVSPNSAAKTATSKDHDTSSPGQQTEGVTQASPGVVDGHRDERAAQHGAHRPGMVASDVSSVRHHKSTSEETAAELTEHSPAAAYSHGDPDKTSILTPSASLAETLRSPSASALVAQTTPQTTPSTGACVTATKDATVPVERAGHCWSPSQREGRGTIEELHAPNIQPHLSEKLCQTEKEEDHTEQEEDRTEVDNTATDQNVNQCQLETCSNCLRISFLNPSCHVQDLLDNCADFGTVECHHVLATDTDKELLVKMDGEEACEWITSCYHASKDGSGSQPISVRYISAEEFQLALDIA